MTPYAWIGLVLALTSLVGGCATRLDTSYSDQETTPAGVPSTTRSELEERPINQPAEPARDPESSAEPTEPTEPTEEALPAEPVEPSTESTAPAEPSEPTTPQATAALFSVPDANITIDGVSADGQRLDRLECRADDLPVFGSLAVVASIAEAKPALDRCAPKGGAVALTWSFRAGKARDIEVSRASSPAVGRCVAKAMRSVVAPFTARCGATVLVGDDTGADGALAALKASE